MQAPEESNAKESAPTELNQAKPVNHKKKDVFTRFATHTARLAGTPLSFGVAVAIIAAWALTGPIFNFSDTWQLVINTSTTIVTFLMVFLIQNTQNRDSEALHLKLDELIRATRGAKNALIDLEDLTQEELDAFKRKFAVMAEKGRLEDAEDLADLIAETSEETRKKDKHPRRH
ncbi:MAG TPA: low affinity iron permease family protein [Coleofasciculaceae cyanobacterium]|jgi:low affinity Fe/Cu permease